MSKTASATHRLLALLFFAMAVIAVSDPNGAWAGLNESSGTSTESSRFGLVDAGEYYACGVNNGDILCWGRQSFSWSYGIPTLVTKNSATFRPGTIKDLSVGGYIYQGTACAVVDNGASLGEVWCWGANLSGQFGDSTSNTNDYNEPVRAFGSLTGASRVTVGGNHVCVLLTSGQVRCAGDNASGELGDGSNTQRTSPVAVTTGAANLSNIVSVSAGGATTCAVDSSGATFCWGDSGRYQSGRMSSSGSNFAQAVYDNGGSTSVVVAGQSVCTLGSYGANCWGANADPFLSSQNTPRLGTGDTSNDVIISSPVSVISFVPTAIAGSVTHTCALNASGEVWCWGDNDKGFLGNGTTIDSASAVKANLPEPIDVITAGIAYTCAVSRMGKMWCWGTGDLGALGNGSGAFKSTPTVVSTRSLDWTYMGTAPTTTTTAPTTTTSPTTTTIPTPTTTLPAPTTTTMPMPTTTVAPSSVVNSSTTTPSSSTTPSGASSTTIETTNVAVSTSSETTTAPLTSVKSQRLPQSGNRAIANLVLAVFFFLMGIALLTRKHQPE